jgi:hypothetical protein
MTKPAAGLSSPVNSRPRAERRRDFATVLRMMATLRSPWQIGAAGFEVRVPFRALAGIRGSLVYKVHTIGWAERRMRFFGSVTIWPRMEARVTRRLGKASAARVEKACQERCNRVLRQQGYRARWHRTPWGKFGDYWKPLQDLRKLYAEIRLYESWVVKPPWSIEVGSALWKPRRR